jgi:hypothetical protein
MKKIQNKNIGLFNCKSFGVAALITLLWLGNTNSSFGYVTISSSASADCSGSVSVSGGVQCFNCESSPTVGIVWGDSEPVLPVVTGGCDDAGTYAATTVYLIAGVNVITVSDTCGGEDSVSVVSNGGGGPAFVRTEYSHTPTGHKCPGGDTTGFNRINWNVSCYCLPLASYGYQETEKATGEDPTDCFYMQGMGGLDNGEPAHTDLNHNFIASNNDSWKVPCFHNGCYHSCSLERHIYDPLVNTISTTSSDVAVETVTVTALWTSSSGAVQLSGGGSSYTWSD